MCRSIDTMTARKATTSSWGVRLLGPEALNFPSVSAGGYKLIFLPLRLVGAQVAPARAAPRPLHHFSA